MNILVHLAHPAQYHFYRRSIQEWKKNGNNVIVAIKTKDILEQLLINDNVDYYNINDKQHRGSKLGMLLDMLIRDSRILRLCISEKIDLLTGSTAEVAQIGWLLRKYSVCIGEDDADIVPIYVKSVLPFLQTRLTPNTCKCGRMEPKSIHYAGFQKLAYLHPNVFSPDKRIIEKYGINIGKPYFLVRLVSLSAHHDEGINGLNKGLILQLIEILEQKGQVFISSERPLEPEFEKYRLLINPLDIHHILAFASMFIGDSQSMAVEAAMLGIPNIRFNDFVGKKNIGVLEELEDVYNLTLGIPSCEPDRLISLVCNYLDNDFLNKDFQQRRSKMLSDKIDVSSFLTWFIENYPESKQIMIDNPNYQYRFR